MRLATVLAVLLTAGVSFGQQVRVTTPHGAGSGIAVAQRDGKTLVLTCNHIPSQQPYPNAPYPLAPYPLEVGIEVGGKKLKGKAIGGCEKADLCLVIVDAELPVVPLAKRDVLVGEKVRHYGNRSKDASGVALEPEARPSSGFVATCAAISGDSGAGVFNEKGEICAIICGRVDVPETAPARGCAVSAIHPIVGRVAPQFLDPTLKKRMIQVEQTVMGMDGKTFTRVIEREEYYRD